jgi:uncharacterized protein YcbK (DUF882 family)
MMANYTPLYFKSNELACKDGCGFGLLQMRQETLIRADKFREKLGRPVTVTSAIRCASHNKKVGGKKSSFHLIGEALDFEVSGFKDLKEKVTAAIQAGFGGVGICVDKNGNGFIHCDLGSDRMFLY